MQWVGLPSVRLGAGSKLRVGGRQRRGDSVLKLGHLEHALAPANELAIGRTRRRKEGRKPESTRGAVLGQRQGQWSKTLALRRRPTHVALQFPRDRGSVRSLAAGEQNRF